mmetsp:Transcript_8375/g.19789  ORF Transcript_8375/g.19789 Transcript_8375/m.19789 type:complete len:327 (+) Transcript_8375:431-1411(+)
MTSPSMASTSAPSEFLAPRSSEAVVSPFSPFFKSTDHEVLLGAAHGVALANPFEGTLLVPHSLALLGLGSGLWVTACGAIGACSPQSETEGSPRIARAFATTSAWRCLARAIQSLTSSSASLSGAASKAAATAPSRGVAATVSVTAARHNGHVVSELPLRSVCAKDDFCDIHWSRHPPQQVWPQGSIFTSAFSSRQTGQSSRPVLSIAAFQPFFWLIPSIAAAHGAGLSSAAACARAAVAAARAAASSADSTESTRFVVGPSPISIPMPALRPPPSSMSMSSLKSGSSPSTLSRAAANSSSICRSRSTASSAAFLANSRCRRTEST